MTTLKLKHDGGNKHYVLRQIRNSNHDLFYLTFFFVALNIYSGCFHIGIYFFICIWRRCCLKCRLQMNIFFHMYLKVRPINLKDVSWKYMVIVDRTIRRENGKSINEGNIYVWILGGGRWCINFFFLRDLSLYSLFWRRVKGCV